MFNFKFRKSSQYLNDQESFHFRKSNRYLVSYLGTSTLAFMMFFISISISKIDYFWLLSFSLGLLAFGILFLATEKFYLPYRIHDQNSDKYLKGIIGELRIQKELENIPKKDFSVFQHIEIPKNGDIDFIVVGQGSIFTIEVKNYSYPIKTNGKYLLIGEKDFQNKSIINDLKKRTMFVHECIEKVIKKKFFIHPILVFVGRKNVLEFEPRDIAGVFVCDEKSLVKTLAEHIASDGRLPVEDIKKIIDVVESMAQINLNEV